MARCIFIVEDNLTDIFGCLLTLQAILNAGCAGKNNDVAMRDIHLCFLHICTDEWAEEAENRFNKAFRESQRIIRECKYEPLESAKYKAITLKHDLYAADRGIDEAVEKIIQAQKDYLKDCGFTHEFLQSFPTVNGDDTYVLLLDVILLETDNTDQDRIQSCQQVLSVPIYKKFPPEHCITYTNYRGYYGDKWVTLAGVGNNEMPIERERLTRARGIYIPLKKRLYRALKISEG